MEFYLSRTESVNFSSEKVYLRLFDLGLLLRTGCPSTVRWKNMSRRKTEDSLKTPSFSRKSNLFLICQYFFE